LYSVTQGFLLRWFLSVAHVSSLIISKSPECQSSPRESGCKTQIEKNDAREESLRPVSVDKNDSNWILWAMLWYGLLALMAVISYKFGHFTLSLITIGLLSIYGLILFSDKTLAGKAHRANRVHPWLILCLGISIAYTGDRWWFAEPRFASIAAEQNPFEIPLQMKGINLDMTPSEILGVLGEPTLREDYYFGEIQHVKPSAVLTLVTAMQSVKGRIPGLFCRDPEAIMEVVEPNSRDSEPDYLHSDQSWVSNLLDEAKKGRTLRVLLIDLSLSKETAQRALRKLGKEEVDVDNLVIVSSSDSSPGLALSIENPQIGSHWRYEELDLDVLFQGGDELTPVAIGGKEVSIGATPWSKTGRRLERLHSPGRPLEETFLDLYDDRLYETYRKDWGRTELRVGSEFGKIERIEVWQRDAE
jgi:hypothetical protein